MRHKQGDTLVVDMEMTEAAASDFLKGQTVQATLEVKEVKKLRLPELSHEFLHNFGLHTPEQFHEYINIILEKRLEYQQRQSAREQILQQLMVNSKWELPNDLLQHRPAGPSSGGSWKCARWASPRKKSRPANVFWNAT